MKGLEAMSNSGHVRRPLVLAICCMSILIVGLDVTILNVALPAIQDDFHERVSVLSLDQEIQLRSHRSNQAL